jgi:hypothetical protein
MVRFFPHAPDTTASGTPAYARTLLRINRQYFLTGLVEIQYTSDQQLVLFVSEGLDVGAFHVSEKMSIQIDPEEIPNYWKSGNGSVRSISLPRSAVRAARQVLEWSPPVQSMRAKNQAVLMDYIETCKAQRANGLFHFLWPRSEAYLSLYYGQLMPIDAVFSQPAGVDCGREFTSQILDNPDSPCQITFLEARPTSLSFLLQSLRIAMSQLLETILTGYSQQLGPGQARALATDLNDVMREKPWYLQINGNHFEDTHVFPNLETAVQAYQTLVKHMFVHMYNAAGKAEAHILLSEAFNSLPFQMQQTIQKYALLPAVTTS